MPKRPPLAVLLAAAATVILAGCHGKTSCVCTAVGNASDVVTVDNDGGCDVAEEQFTDPQRSCIQASGSLMGPSTPLSLALEPANHFAAGLPSFPVPAAPPSGTAYLMK
ncbi:MAG: hypothetical protein AB7L66_00760 [Gemmatimonadales bacterium]